MLQNRNTEQNEIQCLSTPVDLLKCFSEGRLQRHDVCHLCLTFPELIRYKQLESAFTFWNLFFMKGIGQQFEVKKPHAHVQRQIPCAQYSM